MPNQYVVFTPEQFRALDDKLTEISQGGGGGIADGSVATEKLANGAVTTAKLAQASIDERTIVQAAPRHHGGARRANPRRYVHRHDAHVHRGRLVGWNTCSARERESLALLAAVEDA